MNEFIPRLRAPVFPTSRRAVLRHGRIVRPRNAAEVLLFGRPTRSGKLFHDLNAGSQRVPSRLDMENPTTKQPTPARSLLSNL